MNKFHESEIEIFRRVMGDPTCAALEITANLKIGTGVVVKWHGRPVRIVSAGPEGIIVWDLQGRAVGHAADIDEAISDIRTAATLE